MDVNLSQHRITESPNGDPYSPGAGGWPTIRYFNKETGIKGGAYVKKTSGAMCDELGDQKMMDEYVEEYGKTSICSVDTKEGCDEREVKYIAKMASKSSAEVASQLARLEKMQDASMKPELLVWLQKRKKILRQLANAGEGAEL